ncbi:hypothetical protein ACH5RR_009164 [Cinchona calisaya]|uniref:Uncharacterized protein n=1 Tax=Cinchona calisaya TaxID=153742 RepID=A0ABD3ADN7_9GENT
MHIDHVPILEVESTIKRKPQSVSKAIPKEVDLEHLTMKGEMIVMKSEELCKDKISHFPRIRIKKSTKGLKSSKTPLKERNINICQNDHGGKRKLKIIEEA